MSKPYIRLDKNNAAVLLVDHQTGLLSLVRDIEPDTFRNIVLPWPISQNTQTANHPDHKLRGWTERALDERT